jgi:hypothetical protein
MRPHVFAAALLLSACTEGLRHDWFVKDEHRYHVAAPDPSQWKPVKFADNDLAWVDGRGQLMAMNSTCRNFEDAPLDVLTNHLMMGFTEKLQIDRKTFSMDGRDAMETIYTARLDGVPVDISVAVLKKDDCVYDFTHVAPLGQGAEHLATFERLLDGFTTGEGPPPRRVPSSATVKLGTPEVRPDDAKDPEPEAKAP